MKEIFTTDLRNVDNDTLDHNLITGHIDEDLKAEALAAGLGVPTLFAMLGKWGKFATPILRAVLVAIYENVGKPAPAATQTPAS